MLYQVFETQRTMMEPFVDFAQAAAKLFKIGRASCRERVYSNV